MWIYSTLGFFSIVQHKDDPSRVIVRARERRVRRVDALKVAASNVPELQQRIRGRGKVEVPVARRVKRTRP